MKINLFALIFIVLSLSEIKAAGDLREQTQDKGVLDKDTESFVKEPTEFSARKTFLQTIDNHPYVTAALLGMGTGYIYNKSPYMQKSLHEVWEKIKRFTKFKVIVPVYAKYEDINESGLSTTDKLSLAGLVGSLLVLKKAHDSFDLVTLSKDYCSSFINSIRATFKEHPYLSIAALSTLLVSITGYKIYKNITEPIKNRSISPLNYFLMGLSQELREEFKTGELKQLVLKGDLFALTESDAFIAFVQTLSDAKKQHVYELIDELTAHDYEEGI